MSERRSKVRSKLLSLVPDRVGRNCLVRNPLRVGPASLELRKEMKEHGIRYYLNSSPNVIGAFAN